METQGFQTKTEWIYAEVREMIASGELASDTRLPLAWLAERFGTSEIPVREALRMLQRDGLVRIESHRGATVAAVSWQELYEAILVRTHLEILAAREAAPLHTPETIAALEEPLEAMDRLARSGDPDASDRFSAENRRFHRLLYEPCPYPLLLRQIDELWDGMWRTRSRSLFAMEPAHMASVQEDHREMLTALRAGDTDQVEALATEHRERNLVVWRTVIDRATAGVKVGTGDVHLEGGSA